MTTTSPTTTRRRPLAALRPGAVARGEDGFILLESIVALSLITVIMAALGTFTLRAVTATNELRARQAAAQVATSAMANVDALPAADLKSNRNKTAVDDQFARYPRNATINSALAYMTPAYDNTPGLAADAGKTAPVSTSTQSVTLNGITYSVDSFVGTCAIPSTSDDDPTVPVTKYCTASSTSLTYRVVVAVTWPSGRGCSNAAGCTFVSSTIINANDDPVFNTNRATPPATPIVVPPGDQTSTVGGPVSLQLKVKSGTGVNPMTWTLPSGTSPSGALPTGLTLTGDGIISGTPTVVTATPAQLTVMVTDAFGRTGTASFTWTVVAAPTVTTPANQSSRANRAITPLSVASSCPNAPCSFAMTGAPNGLTIDASTGAISGTPTTVGTSSNVVVTITDAASVSASTAAFTWTVTAPGPTVTSPGDQNLTVGNAVSIPIPYTCPNPSCTITVTNGIPGLTLTNPSATANNATPETASKFTTPGSVDTTGTSNLSLNKSATQSTTYSSGSGAGKAVDGNTDGVFNNGSVSHTGGETQPWWQVDLGAASLVRAVRIYNRTDCCDTRLSNFYVFTSPTDMSGKTAAQLLADPTVTVQRISGLNGAPSITVPAQSAGRYVRVQLAGLSGGTNYLHMAEVQVLGTPDPGTSITVNNTSGTVYLSGTVPTSAVPSGATSKAYSPNLSIVDVSNASDAKSGGNWIVYAAPTISALGDKVVRAGDTPSVALSYSCPIGSCTLKLAGTVPGLGLSTSAGATNGGSTLNVTGATGTVYYTGKVATGAITGNSTSTSYTPQVTIADSNQVSANTSGTWVATKAAAYLINPGTQVVETGDDVALQLAGSCAAGCSWSGSVSAAPGQSQTTLSQNGLLKWTGSKAGTYTFSIKVTDANGGTDTESFTVKVVSAITVDVPDKTTTQPSSGTTVTTVDVASLVNPQANGYTYALSGAPSWMSIDYSTGLLTANVTSSTPKGTYSVTVTVTSDASSTSTATDTFTWTVQ